MRVLLLLAGMGRRFGEATRNNHKSLIGLSGVPLIRLLVDRFLSLGQREFVAVVGHEKARLTEYLRSTYGDALHLCIVDNPDYHRYNNLHSLWLAKNELSGTSFLLCNGDVILNVGILERALGSAETSEIVVDDSSRSTPIDSPGTVMRGGRILDLGRHIPFDATAGYAIGLYRFTATLSQALFETAEKMLNAGETNAGFHDPLPDLFPDHPVFPLSTAGMSWTDLDAPDEIPAVERKLSAIRAEERGAGRASLI
jgi:choline kinase